ncbi:hypothetical protein HNQ50_001287 [Silvimonas terrae]|uniref:Uncharacterized protein n=1 Tax=Silvimonas terrae TaxID=300266 RepID=A0A840RB41_9NEIS|nr:hypothetical protein [Silvimonas terrae]MBB5190565.1 hypothetical protein [Silvimonas terrae]
MTTELRGSGPVARLMGIAVVRAKGNTPQSRFNLAARGHTPSRPEADDAEEMAPTATPAAPVVATLPAVAEVSTAAWLRRLSIEKRIAPADAEADPGVVAATPASVYGAAAPSPSVSSFSAKG